MMLYLSGPGEVYNVPRYACEHLFNDEDHSLGGNGGNNGL